MKTDSHQKLTLKLINALYVEAMVLADEARAYFDQHSHSERGSMSPLARVTFSCESLKVTARLMHVIAWLLTRRAIAEGVATTSDDRLGHAAGSEPEHIAGLPEDAQQIILSSIGLYGRVSRLEAGMAQPLLEISPARRLQSRLMQSL
jgi:regulator of CtrA degradation